jgi:hypothetical protein
MGFLEAQMQKPWMTRGILSRLTLPKVREFLKDSGKNT